MCSTSPAHLCVARQEAAPGTGTVRAGDWCPPLPIEAPSVSSFPQPLVGCSGTAPPSLRPFSAPVAKSLPPAGFCCMEICTKQLFIVRLPTAGKSYLFIPHNPSTFLPAFARPLQRQGCEGWQRSLRSPQKVILSVLCCGQRKKLASSVVCTTG